LSEKEELVKKLKSAENAPAEVRRQMTDRLNEVKKELSAKQKELENQRDEVHRELVNLHQIEKQKIA
jgi:replicative DNA helicase